MFALKSWRFLPALLFLLLPAAVRAADLHVAPSGSDTTSNGALATPFRTIQKAADTALPGDTVIISTGTYRETVRPARSGTAGSPITYRAFESGGVYEDVNISGADIVTGWSAHDTANDKAIYKTTAMGWNLSDSVAAPPHRFVRVSVTTTPQGGSGTQAAHPFTAPLYH